MAERISLDDVLELPGSARNSADVVQTLVEWSEQVTDREAAEIAEGVVAERSAAFAPTSETY